MNLLFNEDLDKYYTGRKETEAEWDRINQNRGPMGTVLTTEESTNDWYLPSWHQGLGRSRRAGLKILFLPLTKCFLELRSRIERLEETLKEIALDQLTQLSQELQGKEDKTFVTKEQAHAALWGLLSGGDNTKEFFQDIETLYSFIKQQPWLNQTTKPNLSAMPSGAPATTSDWITVWFLLYEQQQQYWIMMVNNCKKLADHIQKEYR